MSATTDKIAAIKANIAELQAQLEKLEGEDGKVAEFAETFAMKDIGLGPLTVANVVAAWEDYKQGKAVDNSAIAEPIDPTGEDSA